MASLDDILTTGKNIVTAITNLAQTYSNIQGIKNSGPLTTDSLVKSSSGRVATVVVTVAGAAAGSIYDANDSTSTSNKIYTIPNTLGIYVLNMPTSFGIVVAPGAGMTVVVSYS
jgi:hypothetical protein